MQPGSSPEPRGKSFWFSLTDRLPVSFFPRDSGPHCILLLWLFCGPSDCRPTERGAQDSLTSPSPSLFLIVPLWAQPSLELLRACTLRPGAWAWGPWRSCSYFGPECVSFSGRWPGQGQNWRWLNSGRDSWRTEIPGTLLTKQPQTNPRMLAMPTLLSFYLFDSLSCQCRKKFLYEYWDSKPIWCFPSPFFFFLSGIRELFSSNPALVAVKRGLCLNSCSA